MKILCEEHDKYGSRRPARYILSVKVDSQIIHKLQLRMRFNPELVYYLTKLDEKRSDEEILAMFGNQKMRKEPNFVVLT